MNIIESWVFFPYQIKNVTVCWLSAEHLTVLKYLALYILKKLNFPSPVHNSTRIKKKHYLINNKKYFLYFTNKSLFVQCFYRLWNVLHTEYHLIFIPGILAILYIRMRLLKGSLMLWKYGKSKHWLLKYLSFTCRITWENTNLRMPKLQISGQHLKR